MSELHVVVVSWRGTAHPLAGGSELLVDRLLSGLTERGHRASLVCGGPVGAHPYEATEAGGTYGQYLRAPIECLRRYRDADVLIDVSNGLPFFSPLWWRGPAVCLVNHVHTDQWGTRFGPLLACTLASTEHRVVPTLYRRRQIVAVSDSTALGLERLGVSPDRVTVIEPGVDVVPHSPKSERSAEPLVVMVGRLVPHKRVELALNAWALAQREVGGRLVIVGDGPEARALRRAADGVPGVELTGWLPEEDKRRLLSQAWLLLHTAHHEGWGLVVTEAGAHETPVVAIDVPGVRDAVVDGETGLLVSEEPGARGDTTACALADAISRLVRDPERRNKMGRAARQRAEGLSWDHMVTSWETLLTEMARPEPPRLSGRRKHAHSGPLGPVRRGPAQLADAVGASRRPRAGGLGRSIELLNGFRTQFDDPDGFYTLLADDTVELVRRYDTVDGARVLDVGGGPGYFAEAFRRAGAAGVFVEPFWEEMTEAGRSLRFGVLGDGLALPFRDGAFDIGHCSNVIEHVESPKVLLDELVRVVRPGGLVFLAFTNWLSPFGGHETSPWHYLGGERAVRRYERRHGYQPKNRFGDSLFRLGVGETLSMVERRPDVELIDAFPRYYPSWTKRLVRLPGVREVLTWNLALALRRR